MSTAKPPLATATLNAIKGTAGVGRQTLKAKTRGRLDRDRVSMTFFIDRSSHRRLKELAMERNTSQQQLMSEALDEWLARQGEPQLKQVSFAKESGQ